MLPANNTKKVRHLEEQLNSTGWFSPQLAHIPSDIGKTHAPLRKDGLVQLVEL